jgi:hypothetical protein
VGAAMTFSSTKQLVVAERTLPSFPILFLLAPDGLLVTYYVFNTTDNAAQVISQAVQMTFSRNTY